MEESATDRELRAMFEASYDQQGIDRSVIRSMLGRSPDERLANLEANINFILEARRGRNPHNPASTG